MGNFRSINFGETTGKVLGYTCNNLILCVPSTSVLNSTHPSWHLLTKDLCLKGLRESQASITASCNCCCFVGGLSISRIWIAIWSQIYSIGFFGAGQSMTSTSWFSNKSHSGPCLVWRSITLNQHNVISKGAPCAGQDILPEHPLVNQFTGPSTMTGSLLSPKWKEPHTMMDGTTLPSVFAHKHQYISHPHAPANSNPSITAI